MMRAFGGVEMLARNSTYDTMARTAMAGVARSRMSANGRCCSGENQMRACTGKPVASISTFWIASSSHGSSTAPQVGKCVAYRCSKPSGAFNPESTGF